MFYMDRELFSADIWYLEHIFFHLFLVFYALSVK